MDKLSELEQRLDEYKKHSCKAEQMALQKLALYPPFNRTMTAADVLRRELLRHHTRTLLLDEMKQWILELKGMRLYQLYTIAKESSQVMFAYSVRQYMTEREVAEVNATFEKNDERLRWRPVDPLEESEDET